MYVFEYSEYKMIDLMMHQYSRSKNGMLCVFSVDEVIHELKCAHP